MEVTLQCLYFVERKVTFKVPKLSGAQRYLFLPRFQPPFSSIIHIRAYALFKFVSLQVLPFIQRNGGILV
jgi:hypothetical protein